MKFANQLSFNFSQFFWISEIRVASLSQVNNVNTKTNNAKSSLKGNSRAVPIFLEAFPQWPNAKYKEQQGGHMMSPFTWNLFNIIQLQSVIAFCRTVRHSFGQSNSFKLTEKFEMIEWFKKYWKMILRSTRKCWGKCKSLFQALYCTSVSCWLNSCHI